jgi:hypothetical protein
MFSINISLSNILKTRDFIQVSLCVRCVASQEENMLIYSTLRKLSEISWQFDGVKSGCIIFLYSTFKVTSYMLTTFY